MTNFDDFYQIPVASPIPDGCNVMTVLVPKAWGERARVAAQRIVDAGMADQANELMLAEGLIPGTANYKP